MSSCRYAAFTDRGHGPAAAPDFEVELHAMTVQQASAEEQPQSEMTRLAGEEWFSQSIAVFVRDARTRVPDG
jgi:hypothetical protein